MPDMAVPTEESERTGLDGLLARAGAKDRTHIQRHLAACDAEPEPSHAALWRRIAGTLSSLAPLPVQTAGHSAVLFFVPDGKYRMQMFALEDQSDGRIAVYLPDILQEAIRRKLLRKGDVPHEFAIVGSLRSTLRIESLDSQNTPEPPAHVKNMLGWNRKSLRVTLPALAADGPRVQAVEALCALAAKEAGPVQPKPAAPAPAEPAARPSKATGSKKRPV